MISTRDQETLAYLFRVEKSILDEYNGLENGDFSRERLETFLDMEETLLDGIELNKVKFDELEKLCFEQIGVNLYSELPLGISPFMTDTTYPHIRLLARLRRKYKETGLELESMTESYLLDTEIGVLYNALVYDSELYDGMSEGLRRYAWRILVDSPSIERDVVQRGMQPLREVEDVYGFGVDFVSVCKVREAGCFGLPRRANAENRRVERYDSLSKEAAKMAQKYMDLYKSGQTSKDVDFMMCVAYFKAIIATQSKEKRQKIYRDFDKDNKLKLDEWGQYYDFVSFSQNDIENVLSALIKRVDFVNYNKVK